jgi:Na+-driven multidrug efflux pump
MFFNYGAAVMRAVGDSRRPTTYLMISGAVNVVFNLLFVIVFDMSVVGVALATVISQLLSAALVAVNLLRTHTVIRVDVRSLRIVPREMAAQLRIGFPVGIQKSMYTISNVILQTAVNGFGSVTMAGSGAAANLESFLYAGMSCFYTAVLTFTSQNMGARQVDRMKKAAPICASCSFLTGLTIGSIVMLFRETLLSFYTTDPQVIAMAVQRMWVTVLPAAIVGASDAFVGCMRGMGQVFKPMLISIAFVCGLRLIWVYVFFPLAPSLGMLYLSYPISWSMMLVAQTICYLLVRKKIFRQLEAAA